MSCAGNEHNKPLKKRNKSKHKQKQIEKQTESIETLPALEEGTDHSDHDDSDHIYMFVDHDDSANRFDTRYIYIYPRTNQQ